MTTIKTVADLKKEIQVYKSENGLLPGAVSLYESGIRVMYHIENEPCDIELNVYENGLVYYRCGKSKTVFRLHKVPNTYDFSNEAPTSYASEEINWEFHLMQYGDERLWTNQDVKEQRLTVSYADLVGDSVEVELRGPVNLDPAEALVKKELVELVCNIVTEKQAEVFRLVYEDNLTQQEAADRLGMSRTAVANAISRVYETIRKHKNEVF